MDYVAKNNARSKLAGSLSAGAVSLTVLAGQGDRFPIVTSGTNYSYCTLINASGTILEIVKITARSAGADAMTIQRGQLGTAAQAWNTNDIIECRPIADLIAQAINDRAQHEAAADPHPQYLLLSEADLLYSSISSLSAYQTVAGMSAYQTVAGMGSYVPKGAFAGCGLTMATAKLLGRTTASSGSAEEISVGTGLSLSGGTLSCTVTGGVTTFNSRSGAVSLTSGDVTTALGYTPPNGTFVAKDNGSLAVGSYVIGVTSGNIIANGGTVAGSLLKPACMMGRVSGSGDGASPGANAPDQIVGAALTGTWRNVSGIATTVGYYDGTTNRCAYALWQRIA